MMLPSAYTLPWTSFTPAMSNWPEPSVPVQNINSYMKCQPGRANYNGAGDPATDLWKYGKESFSPRFASSSETSPTYTNTGTSFAFESAPVSPPTTAWNMNNIDQLAAKLLTIEEHPLVSPMMLPTSTPRLSPETVGDSSPDELSLPSQCRDEASGDSSDPDADILPNSRFKTEICRNFKEKGKCLYGDLCQFAHGNEEMQNVGQHNKYKTKRCQKYWIKGYCAYGPRCNFLHYEERDQVLPKYSQNIQINQKKITTVVRKGSAGEFSGCSSSSTPSSSPPKMKLKLPTTPLPLEILHRPSFGSGRLAAYTKDGELYWLDTRTQKFV